MNLNTYVVKATAASPKALPPMSSGITAAIDTLYAKSRVLFYALCGVLNNRSEGKCEVCTISACGLINACVSGSNNTAAAIIYMNSIGQ